ncbi:hypothetical protein Tco_0804710 [Tanacetum coccineum]|uniref:Uncharacterized protein n=1 Tax=Tanacetum coccineum TaxID=301880 RepID=A0ABQ5A624_9ASTR
MSRYARRHTRVRFLDYTPTNADRTDFESWQHVSLVLSRKGLWSSREYYEVIKEGPFQMGTVSMLLLEETSYYLSVQIQPKGFQYGIPKDIYSLINHYTDTKDIWENVKMILEGSELTKDDRES